MARLDEKSSIEMGFPYDFYLIAYPAIYDNVLSSIDHHRIRQSGFPTPLLLHLAENNL